MAMLRTVSSIMFSQTSVPRVWVKVFCIMAVFKRRWVSISMVFWSLLVRILVSRLIWAIVCVWVSWVSCMNRPSMVERNIMMFFWEWSCND